MATGPAPLPHHVQVNRDIADAVGRRADLALLVLPGALALAMVLSVGEPMSDWKTARDGGRHLLSGHLDVYADMPWVQMGPLAILLAGVLPAAVYMAVVALLLPLLLWFVTLASPRTQRARSRALVGGMLLVWPWAALSVQGHADDAFVVLGLVMMVAALTTGREGLLIVGFALALAGKPTAVLFLPLAFVHSRRAGLAALLTGGLVWAPFVLADVPGFIDAGQGQGDLWPYSVPDLLGGVPHSGFPDWVRPLQLVGGALLCWFMARRNGPAAAAAGVFAFRVLLEPGTWNYYATCVMAAAMLLDLDRGWRTPWATLLGFVSFAVTLGPPGLGAPEGAARLAALVGVLVLALATKGDATTAGRDGRQRRQRRTPSRTSSPGSAIEDTAGAQPPGASTIGSGRSSSAEM